MSERLPAVRRCPWDPSHGHKTHLWGDGTNAPLLWCEGTVAKQEAKHE